MNHYEFLSHLGQEFIGEVGEVDGNLCRFEPDHREHEPLERSAEHRLGQFQDSSKRAEAVPGAPTQRPELWRKNP